MATSYDHNETKTIKKKRRINAPFDMQIPSSLQDPSDTTFTLEQLEVLTDNDGARNIALKYLHDPETFATVWNSTTLHPNTRRFMRKLVQIQTINAVYNRFYRLPDSVKINLDKAKMAYAAINTRQYIDDYEYDPIRQERTYEQASEILVIQGDSLDAAIFFKNKFPQSNLAVLIMAAAKSPGGAWRNGAGAQEENLHRRTNLFQCLEDPYRELQGQRDWKYLVPEFGGVYVPDASVFRGSESDGYPFFPSGPQYISFIACAAYSHPATEIEENGTVKLAGEDRVENTKKKIDSIFKIALDNKHDILVLSALGCGAYGNPPKHIAQLFHELISTKYRRSFRYIVFAIINDHNCRKEHNPTGNIQPFAEVFRVDPLSVEELPERFSQFAEEKHY